MRGIRSTLVLLVIALGLGAYIYFIESERSPAGTPGPLEAVFDFVSDDIVSLSVTAENGDHTVIEKDNDRWRLVEPFAGNVDVTKVVALSSGLASLEIQRLVAEPDDNPDLGLFGLDMPLITVGVETISDSNLQLLIGERTPTGNDLYATVADSNRVFLISGFLDTTFNQTTFDLRNKSILDITSNQVDSLEITGPTETIRLQKDQNQWSLVSPITARADTGVADGVVGRLTTGQMASVEVESADNLKPYGLEQPRLSITVGLGDSAATLLIGETTSTGNAYARDASRGLVFTIDGSIATELEQGVDEYRQRNLFDFRPFNASTLELDHLGEQWTFERTETTDEGEAGAWRRTSPDIGEVETSAMDDLLAKLSNLRAESFVSSRDDTGLDAPIATVEVTFNDQQEQERVTFGQTGDEIFATGGDEPGAALLNARSWEDTLAALTPLQ